MVEWETSHSTVWVSHSSVFPCFLLPAFPTLLRTQFIDLPWWSRPGDSQKSSPLQVVAPASPHLRAASGCEKCVAGPKIGPVSSWE